MPKIKTEIPVIISNLEVLEEWRKKEAQFSASIILNQIKKELSPDQWVFEVEAVIERLKQEDAGKY